MRNPVKNDTKEATWVQPNYSVKVNKEKNPKNLVAKVHDFPVIAE